MNNTNFNNLIQPFVVKSVYVPIDNATTVITYSHDFKLKLDKFYGLLDNYLQSSIYIYPNEDLSLRDIHSIINYSYLSEVIEHEVVSHYFHNFYHFLGLFLEKLISFIQTKEILTTELSIEFFNSINSLSLEDFIYNEDN